MATVTSERTFLMSARRTVGIAVAAAAALLVIGVGVAQADDDSDEREGYPSTQSPTQGADAGAATLDNAGESIEDGANGDDRPDGADGTDTEFSEPDSRFIEGPLGGLANNGPLE
ncbi:MAG: hypothetical protein ACT4O0_12465 [Pseudonocardia sp.]|jgi:hypothetical protein